MLMTIAAILLILWLLGLLTSTTMGGFIHVLVVAAAVIFLVKHENGQPLHRFFTGNHDWIPIKRGRIMWRRCDLRDRFWRDNSRGCISLCVPSGR